MANTRPELCCYLCHARHYLVTAVKLAPYTEVPNAPCVWRPVCESHLNSWYETIDPNDQLPVFDLSTP